MKPPKHRRRADERPDEILDAALECFTNTGYAATRVEDIAEKAGISKATVYLYFNSKEALLTGLVRRAIAPVPEQAGAAVAAFQGTVRQSMEMFLGHIAEKMSDPKMIALPLLVLRESIVVPELADMYRTEVLDRAIPMATAILQRGIDSGEFRNVNAELAVRNMIGPVMAQVVLAHVFGVGDNSKQAMQALLTSHLDILMTGLEVR